MSNVESQPTIRAAAYVRMSTEHQQYSTNNQMDVIRDYAARRGMDIVKTYSDEGKSGLNIQGHDSLGQMISDVQDQATDFACILVYDVSRWGRFQDADEHLCVGDYYTEEDRPCGASECPRMNRTRAVDAKRHPWKGMNAGDRVMR